MCKIDQIHFGTACAAPADMMEQAIDQAAARVSDLSPCNQMNAKISMWSRIGNAGMSRAGSLLWRHPFTFLIGFVLCVVVTTGGYLYWDYARHFESR